jgi:hypothetical protein
MKEDTAKARAISKTMDQLGKIDEQLGHLYAVPYMTHCPERVRSVHMLSEARGHIVDSLVLLLGQEV